ncbi:IucA/IucC family C-terminal-domain containing protein [Paenibacillus solisilvae]|uniref:IucA/IucC family C-terminal-domain containing protein n=1 Tax=Paenibacillus solisilvae TaxID=2486751 RepID=A0ABW0W7F4_9BACL
MTEKTGLKPEELAYLTQSYPISTHSRLQQASSISMADLVDEAKCAAYLDRLTGALGSPSRMITASQFAKRYAFLAAAPSLYAMTVFDKGLDLSLKNCHLVAPEGQLGAAGLSLADLQVTVPTAGNRAEWRQGLINGLFADNLAPVLRTLSQAANIPMAILWENTAVRVYSLYEKRIAERADSEAQSRSRAQDDYEYLVRQAPAALFGEKENPLATFFGTAKTDSSTPSSARIRKTCCFYYEVSSIREYCSACPKVKS